MADVTLTIGVWLITFVYMNKKPWPASVPQIYLDQVAQIFKWFKSTSTLDYYLDQVTEPLNYKYSSRHWPATYT